MGCSGHDARMGSGALGSLARVLLEMRGMVIAREVVAACPCTNPRTGSYT